MSFNTFPKLAVIDTNVLVSALISFSKNYQHSPSAIILNNVYQRKLIPIYSEEILQEYEEVLNRPKLKIAKSEIDSTLKSIQSIGLKVNPQKAKINLVDADDLPFYELILETYEAGAYLITGNLKHFPVENFVINPKDALIILDLIRS